jgi:putative peptide zinc metalloprotease protein
MAVLVDDVALGPPAVRTGHVRRLAEGTELLGEYQDSGYQTPKFLVRRADGQVMQLPQLLYSLAVSLDGRDAEQIARALCVELGEELTAEQVSFLVEERLRPAGLVAPDDTDAADVETPAPMQSDLLLALRYRVGVVPASVSWRVAGVFRPLFARPVWVLALGALVALDLAIVLQANLIDSLTSGVTALIHRPALNLLLIAIVLLSGVFHECGHVTACRYGGARPGEMGIGLYLVWPAFYSTVTDSYRLGRVGRLRTDLGGVYFNAISIAALSGLYLATGQPWLLVAVFALHTETAWQFLPTIRFDGYYMLADVAGVPELFSYIGPVLKSLVPGRPTHPRVRELRPWSRRLIVGWAGLTVPVLLFYFVVFLLVVPRVLPLVWAAVLEYLDTMQTAIRTGDVATVALSVFQLFMLLLPWVGSALIGVMLTRMLRRLAFDRWGWAWARPGTGATVRRYMALAAVAGLAGAFLGRLWGVATSAPAATAETRISSSAFGLLRLGGEAAPDVAPGEVMVRDQLAAYGRLTGAFDRHADVLTGARELAVLACVALLVCFLAVARILRWGLWAVGLPLAAVAVMGPAATALVTVSPGVVGAAWAAVGGTLILAARHHGRHRRRPRHGLHRLVVVVGALAVAMGLATAPVLTVPLAIGTALLVVSRGAHPGRPAHWLPLAVAAFVLTALAPVAALAVLRVPGSVALNHAGSPVLLLVAIPVIAAGAAMRDLRWTAVTTASLLVLAALPVAGAAGVLPLVVCGTVLLGALFVQTMTRSAVEERPHPLLRAAVAVPVLVLAVAGALFLPAHAPELPHRALAQWLTTPGAPSVVAVSPPVWADLVRDGVPSDRLQVAASGSEGSGEWFVAVGTGDASRVLAAFGSGGDMLTVLRSP